MRLFANHLEAWTLTGIISVLALWLHAALTPATLAIPVVLMVAVWLGFAVNDLHDAPHDAQDAAKARRNAFVGMGVGARHVVIALFWAVSVALTLALFGYGPRGLVMAMVGFAALLAYSVPPVRAKRRPGLDLLMHAAFVQSFPYIATLWLARLPVSAVDVAWVALLALSSLAAQLEQQIRDYPVDVRTERNFTVAVGVPVSAALLRGVSGGLLTFGAAMMWHGWLPPALLPLAVLGALAVGHRLVRRFNAPRSERLMRVGALLAAGYTAVLLLLSR